MGKVLIVDDERSIRETLSEFIRESGHETFTAAEAEEALSIVVRSAPDVVVSDIILPGVDGMALLERVHRVAPDVQVIMITGEPTVETATDAVRQGAFDYLSKPVPREEIQAAVESAMRTKRVADERTRLTEENLRYRDHLEEAVEQKTRALAANEEKYRTVVETANEAVFVAQDGVLRFANPKTREVTGYSEAQLLSMPFPELIHHDDREMVLDRYRRRLAGEDVSSEYAFRILDADGATKWIESRPVAIEWDGRPASLYLASDVTDRKRAEERVAAANERLRYLLSATSAVIYTAKSSGDYGATFVQPIECHVRIDRLLFLRQGSLAKAESRYEESSACCLNPVNVVQIFSGAHPNEKIFRAGRYHSPHIQWAVAHALAV